MPNLAAHSNPAPLGLGGDRQPQMAAHHRLGWPPVRGNPISGGQNGEPGVLQARHPVEGLGRVRAAFAVLLDAPAEDAENEGPPIAPLGDAGLVWGHFVKGGDVLRPLQHLHQFGANGLRFRLQFGHPGKGGAFQEGPGGDLGVTNQKGVQGAHQQLAEDALPARLPFRRSLLDGTYRGSHGIGSLRLSHMVPRWSKSSPSKA